MVCPCCSGKPLSFSEFWNGTNAIRVQCGECGSELKANWVTWAWLVSCISILVLFFIFLFAKIRVFIVPEDVGHVTIVGVVFVCAAASWFTGGYVQVTPYERSDEQGPADPPA